MLEELIYIDGKNRANDIVFYRSTNTKSGENKYIIKFKNNDKEYSYNASRIKIVKSAINNKRSKDVFQYLKQIADTVGLTTEEGKIYSLIVIQKLRVFLSFLYFLVSLIKNYPK